MKPQDERPNGDGAARDTDSEGDEDVAAALEDELSLDDPEAPARALLALNALRKSRQHYDVLLLAAGAELPAHRAVLAAASPYLLHVLGAPPPAAPAPAPAAVRLPGVEPDALRELLEYIYTGRLRVRDAAAARRLYRAAWRLRLEPARAQLAERLLRRLAPADCLETRALPDLAPAQLRALDAYVADHFDELCAVGALAALPHVRVEMLRETSADGGEEAPGAVAAAALAWLRARPTVDDLEELCSRTHLLFVDARGELRDCGELPESRGDAPELQEYRREAVERERGGRRRDAAAPARPSAAVEVGERATRDSDDCCVLAARALGGGGRGARALLALRGRLAVARVAWRSVGGEGAGVARGGPLGGCAPEPDDGERRARLAEPRCAHGAAALGGRLVVCGGYDRARVLRDAEAYDPVANAWTALPAMRSARARFPTARLGRALYVLGGSDGHAELDSVDAFEEEAAGGGAWRARAKLPLARSYAAAAADEERGELYVMGGWAGGLSLKRVHRYSPLTDAWSEAPPLAAGRSQCAGVAWRGALWVLGGYDAWRCLASTETLALGAEGAAWAPGPPLPTARRSVGGAEWRGRLVAAGGSDGAASLRRTEWLAAGAAAWSAGPPLRRARAALGLAVLGDVLFAVGGFDGKEFLSCVECLYSPDGEWTTLCSPRSPPPAPLAAPPHDQKTEENGVSVEEQ